MTSPLSHYFPTLSLYLFHNITPTTSFFQGCCAIGYLLAFRESEYKATAISELQDVYWIAVAYIISGGAFTLAGKSLWIIAA
jgi:hypothetical protein